MLVIMFLAVYTACSGAAVYAQGINWSGNSIGTFVNFSWEKDISHYQGKISGTIQYYLVKPWGKNEPPLFEADLSSDVKISMPYTGWVRIKPEIQVLNADNHWVICQPYQVDSEDLEKGNFTEGQALNEVWIDLEQLRITQHDNLLDISVIVQSKIKVKNKLFFVISWTSEGKEYSEFSRRVSLNGSEIDFDQVQCDLDLVKFFGGGDSPKYQMSFNYYFAPLEEKKEILQNAQNIKLLPDVMKKIDWNENNPEVMTTDEREKFSQIVIDPEKGTTVDSSGGIWFVSKMPVKPRLESIQRLGPDSFGNDVVNKEKIFLYNIVNLHGKFFDELSREIYPYQDPVDGTEQKGYRVVPYESWVHVPEDRGIDVWYISPTLQGIPNENTYFWLDYAVMRFQKGQEFQNIGGKVFMKKLPGQTIIVEVINEQQG